MARQLGSGRAQSTNTRTSEILALSCTTNAPGVPHRHVDGHSAVAGSTQASTCAVKWASCDASSVLEFGHCGITGRVFNPTRLIQNVPREVERVQAFLSQLSQVQASTSTQRLSYYRYAGGRRVIEGSVSDTKKSKLGQDFPEVSDSGVRGGGMPG